MSKPVPTGRELEILKALWRRGRATVREIHEALGSDGRETAYTTVLSLLQIMEQKGLVDHESSGKAYVYRARIERDRTLSALARGFLDSVFDGALGEYVARAIESRRLSEAEFTELEKMIADAKRQTQTPKRRRK
ncbi:MAG TPA: BlaI/MecI/CopY family transcriptional regulator [Pirellulales bacterium]